MADRFLGGYGEEWYDSMIEGRELIWEYNQSRPSEIRKRYEILKKFLGKCHEDTLIEPTFRCDEGYNTFIGENFYANYGLTILDYDKVIIGNNVKFGPNVTLTTATHDIDYRVRNSDGDGDIIGAPIVIGDDVWLGAGVIVLPGVTIGKHAVIGAGSVVTKDIPNDCVAVGSPAKIIRKISY